MTRLAVRRAARIAAWSIGAAAALSGAGYLAYTHRPQPLPERRALFVGVTYEREVEGPPRPLVTHVVEVDLRAPGVRVMVTPGDPAAPRPLVGRTTSELLSELHAQVAINGDFFDPWWSNSPWDYYPHTGDPVSVDGPAASNGVVYSTQARNRRTRTLYVTLDNRAAFDSPPGEPYNAISGISLVEGGEARTGGGDFARALHPRSAVAIDREGRRMLLVAIDGRQPGYSEGATLDELAEVILRHGGFEAANLDGGGSTALVAENASGEPEALSCPVHTRIPGRERPVANHLGVFAERLGR
ncbi:MAG: phosphodiester glycosidase family protein [Polyangiaceae bacterium]|nr:phosphodiester glycosidase family protein [Polyangiaceae bacterium]